MDPDKKSNDFKEITLDQNDRYNLKPPTEEQRDVVSKLENNNVIVDSVAGSGKTTTNLHIALHYNNINILCLTYNAKLKLETRHRVSQLNISNLIVHSYHSFSVSYYDRSAFNDMVLKKIIDEDTNKIRSFSYDLIILDESQDMNPLYYRLAQKICKDNDKRCKLCVLGDRYQSIYQYNNADQRFITYADKLLDNVNDLPWTRSTLSQSFRVTTQMAEFINNCMLGYNRIKSTKNGAKVRYVICNNFPDKKTTELYPLVLLKQYLSLGYRPNQIFILAPSIKSNTSPVRLLENQIKIDMPEVKVFVSTNDEEKVDQAMIENKLVISTYHQTKGLEREIVFVYSFDSSYYELYNRDASVEFCPNPLYVAATRASEHLILLHHNKNGYLPFLEVGLISKYAEVTGFCESSRNKKDNYTYEVSVTNLIKHLPDDVICGAVEYFTNVKIREIGQEILIPKTIEYIDEGVKYKESVSEITGTAIPLQYQYMLTGSIDIINKLPYDENITFHTLSDDDGYCSSTTGYRLDKIIESIKNKSLTIDQLLYISNRWCSYKDGYLFKIKQIQRYDWITIDNIISSMKRIQSLGIDCTTEFEKGVKINFNRSKQKIDISGFIDAICKDCVFEFKTVSNLQKEHYLQLAIYAYLNEVSIISSSHVENHPPPQQLPSNKGNFKTKRYALSDKILYNLNSRGVVIFVYKNGGYKVKNFDTGQIDKITENNVIKKIESQTTNNKCQQTKPLRLIPVDHTPKYRYFLYNILTDELHTIKFDLHSLDKMIEYIVYHKYGMKTEITDETFLQQMSKYKNL